MLKILKTIFNTTIQVYHQSTKLKKSASLLRLGKYTIKNGQGFPLDQPFIYLNKTMRTTG